MKPVIGITMGDAAGVGPEVCLKAAASGRTASCRTVLIGDAALFSETAEMLGIDMKIKAWESPGEIVFRKGTLNVIEAGPIKTARLKRGIPSSASGRASVECVKKAVSLALKSEIDGVCTAPISKQAVFMAGIHYAGHTELLEELCNKKAVMAFVSGKLRVALVSRHIPLARVPGFLTWNRIVETVKTLHDARADFGLAKPSFGILSLNPHAGDGGVIGSEDEKKIGPAVKMIRKLNIPAGGPFPADGYFGSGKYMDYDFTVAMYHDQGLIPYKMKSFGKGVNITVGLPLVRTSADHGTGYDIAGSGKADEGSMIEAVRLAGAIAKKRMAGLRPPKK